MFHTSIEAVALAEMFLLVKMLLADPTTRLHAGVAGWAHPVSYEWILAAQHFDLANAVASKHRPKLYPRPWPDTKNKIGGKKTVHRSMTDVRAILRPSTD